MLGVILLTLLCGMVLGSVTVPASDPNIQYIGRVDKTSEQGLYVFDWPGVQISAAFQGSSSLSVILKDISYAGAGSYWGCCNYYDVFVDGQLTTQVISTSNATQQIISVVKGVSTAQHSISIVRRVEAEFGLSRFGGFVLDDGGSIIQPPARPNRRIEFFGDSITCGWGNDGHYPCQDQPMLENHLHTFSALVAQMVSADVFIESWSGKGLVRNYGCPTITCNETIPQLSSRTLGKYNTPLWNFDWKPQAVVIGLGSNDYGSDPHPPANVFIKGYLDFVNSLLSHYGSNTTFFMLGFIGPPNNANIVSAQTQLKAMIVNAYFIDLSSAINWPDDIGCDSHPAASGHQKYANKIGPIVKAVMGW